MRVRSEPEVIGITPTLSAFIARPLPTNSSCDADAASPVVRLGRVRSSQLVQVRQSILARCKSLVRCFSRDRRHGSDGGHATVRGFRRGRKQPQPTVGPNLLIRTKPHDIRTTCGKLKCRIPKSRGKSRQLRSQKACQETPAVCESTAARCVETTARSADTSRTERPSNTQPLNA